MLEVLGKLVRLTECLLDERDQLNSLPNRLLLEDRMEAGAGGSFPK